MANLIIAFVLFMTLCRISAGLTLVQKRGNNAEFEWKNIEGLKNETTIKIIKDNFPAPIIYFSAKQTIVTKRYRSRIIFNGDFERRLVKFIINNVNDTDAGVYTLNFPGAKSIGQELLILAKPTLPFVNELNEAISTTDYILNCSTYSRSVQQNVYLKMKYKWLINTEMVHDNQTGYHKDNSTLHIKNLTRAHHGMVVQCQAFERKDTISDLSKPLVINVKYAPLKVYLRPNRKRYRLPMGKPLLDITCSADCHPVCFFQWVKMSSTKQEQITFSGFNLSFEKVKEKDSGIYVCLSQNLYGKEYSPEIQIDVSEKPDRPHITELQPPIEGNELQLMCLSSNFSFYNIVQINWATNRQEGTQRKRYISRGNIFSLKNIKIADNGTKIVCQHLSAENVTSEKSMPYILVTLFGPRSIKLSSKITSFSVKTGEVVPDIHCDAQCFPECEIQWSNGLFSNMPKGNVLSLGTLEVAKAGNYNCLARNPYGTELSENFHVDVYDINLKPNFTCIEEHRVDIICTTISNKRAIPYLPWSLIVNQTVLTSLSGYTDDSRRNTLQIPCSLDYEGKYFCRIKINDSKNGYISASTYLSVLGKPKIISLETFESLDTTFASIFVFFYSVPYPHNVSWFRNSNIISNNEKYNQSWKRGGLRRTVFDKMVHYDGFHAQMTISNLSFEDYGIYILEIINNFGIISERIHFKPTDSALIPLLWVMIPGITSGTVFIIVCLSVVVFRRNRKKKRRLKVKQTFEVIFLTFTICNNRLAKLEDTCPSGNYQTVEEGSLDLQNNTGTITQENSSLSDSFQYDYPYPISLPDEQLRVKDQGSYEDIKSERDPSVYETIEGYDDTAVPVFQSLPNSSVPDDSTFSKTMTNKASQLSADMDIHHVTERNDPEDPTPKNA
ncbi:hypothetical protein KUTeg_005766 [Tegillarca granosa]|uniref:Ig-like domain-containing protein n=1 Tax=Tegillarca granosa TaxID=220873 RepID=A0ABQ9FJ70_TEGGR|nr:hypothetical protein KUTeg_005766 [Tegillarca granosa]